jgi:hypothetical protein
MEHAKNQKSFDNKKELERSTVSQLSILHDRELFRTRYNLILWRKLENKKRTSPIIKYRFENSKKSKPKNCKEWHYWFSEKLTSFWSLLYQPECSKRSENDELLFYQGKRKNRNIKTPWSKFHSWKWRKVPSSVCNRGPAWVYRHLWWIEFRQTYSVKDNSIDILGVLFKNWKRR